MEVVDVAIVGGGPAGSTCAAFCAAAGLRTVLIEREKFPREKVCGDCLNPACWPVLRRLKVAEQIRNLSHAKIDAVEFISIGGRKVVVNFRHDGEAEIAVKRSLFDNVLLDRALELGAAVHESSVVAGIRKTAAHNWKIDIVHQTFTAHVLVGADGRNSTVARLCNLLPRPERERIALQAHIPLPRDFGRRIVLQFLPEGYSGQSPVNENELNLCLVGKPASISILRRWAEHEFHLLPNQSWRTITPLTRGAISPAHDNLLLIGDAARVVEPFTGEGIYYALRSGELAANAVAKIIGSEDRKPALSEFVHAHEDMYRRRLWINHLARSAVLSPRLTSALLQIPGISSTIMRLLTHKIVQARLS
jgi:geranylgeranyl reductase family protein